MNNYVVKDWNIEAMTGYKPKTTFYMDLSIAEAFGQDAIKETYNSVFEAWRSDVEYITEFVMALNWKIWEHYQHNEALADLYDKLWRKADAWCCENLQDADLEYYYRITD